jgi:glutaredoxin
MAWHWWWRRRPRPGRAAHLQFVLYTRRGCHLCEVAELRLREQQRRHGFMLQITDVDSDPELAARYGLQVPVVTVNGKLRFRGAVNRVLLERLLRAGGT